MIPIVGINFVGFSLAVLLGAFTFSRFLPKIQAYLLSLGYLIIAIANTDIKKDTLNINNASIEEITMLPGIGTKLAKKIIRNRPYTDINNLIRINGLSSKKLNLIEPSY